MNLYEIRRQDMKWIELAQGRVQWKTFVGTLIDFLFQESDISTRSAAINSRKMITL